MKIMKTLKKELIELANIAGVLKGKNTIFRTMDGEYEILCDDNVYRGEHDLKMIIDPSGDFANMPL